MNEEIMRKAGFSKQVNLVKLNMCPFCKKSVSVRDFRDIQSIKEFKISGLCQECQDEIFGTTGPLGEGE